MSYDKKQFRATIEDITQKLGMYSESSTNLLLGTASQESLFGTYLHQINGPALGPFQMEPQTEIDIWQNFLNYKKQIANSVFSASGVYGSSLMDLKYNLAYQIAIARVHYYRVDEPLPDAGYIEGLGKYWKKYYNTSKGKGTVEGFIKNYIRFVL